VLEFNLSSTALGTGTVTWDGHNATPGVMNASGLNNVDLTNAGTSSGIQLDIGADHDNATVTLKIFKDANNWSTVSVTIPYTAGAATQPLYIPFSSFTIGGGSGAGSFTSVGAIQLQITGSTGAHAQINDVETVGPTQFTANFADYQPATVGSYTFWDLNSDGLKTVGEPGAANVSVQLWQGGNVIATTTTNAAGNYSFTGLAPGAYSVKFITTNGTLFTTQGVGFDPTINSDVSPATGLTPTFNLLSGQSDLTRDAGLLPVDLSIIKSVDNATPTVGSNVNFTLSVSDAAGYSPATGVQVRDLLPAGLTFVSATPAQGSYNSSTGVWSLGSLAAGASTSLLITATVTTPGSKTNTGTVTASDEVDTAPPAQLTSSATVNPIQQVDLQLTKTVDKPTPNVGQNVTFTIGLSDLGPGNATGVAVTDLLPAGLTFVSDTASQGSYNSTTGVWTVGSVNTGTPALTLQSTATGTTLGTKTTLASITAEDQPDTNLNNNQATATVTPQQDDLQITKTVNNPTPNVGQNVTFTITVTNAGPSTATNVIATDLLPAGLTFVSDTTTQGAYNPVTGLWTIGTVGVLTTPITMNMVVTVSTAGVKVNSTSVTGDQYDGDPSNNQATSTVTPLASIGDFVFWDLKYSGLQDAGDTGVPNVTVDLLQNGTVIATTTTNSAGKYQFNSVVPGDYSLQFIPPHGESFTTQNVGTNPAIDSDPNSATGITSTFTVTSGQSDMTHDAGLVPIDLSVTKSVDNSIPIVGDAVTFTITLVNAVGNSQASDVTLGDLLPSGLLYLTSSTSQGTYNSSTGVWNVGTVASGGSATLTVTAIVNTSLTMTNIVKITAADEPDPNATPANQQASAVVTPRTPSLPPPPAAPPPNFSKQSFLAR
jgi:uncharacterized repeat protein (TIGR01451 family)